MISRPLVAGTLAGWWLGDPAVGLEVGAILELFQIAGVPAGGSRVPESGPATVVAAAVAISAGGVAGLALGVLAGLAISETGGATVQLQRHVVTRFVDRIEAMSVTTTRLTVLHVSSILLDFLRGAMITAVGLVIAGWLSPLVVERWPLSYDMTVALILIGAAVHLGALLRGFGGWKNRRVVFLIGLAAGVIGAYL
jgi:mannose/fructose/N-acetylgalactosamine-specific phosphotransferase system component IIC